jgi:hypothetical protein
MRRSLSLFVLIMIGFPALVAAEPLNLQWDAVTLNADGSPLTDFCDYIVYWGTTRGGPYPNSVNVGSATRASIGNLSPALVYYFVVTAKDTTGNESLVSNETSGRPRRVITF